MKAIFGVLSLLVVLAIVGLIAKRQLQAVAPSSATGVVGSTAPFAPDPNAATVAEHARSARSSHRMSVGRRRDFGCGKVTGDRCGGASGAMDGPG